MKLRHNQICECGQFLYKTRYVDMLNALSKLLNYQKSIFWQPSWTPSLIHQYIQNDYGQISCCVQYVKKKCIFGSFTGRKVSLYQSLEFLEDLLDAILIFSNSPMMTRCHQLDSLKTMPNQQESVKKKTLYLITRSN